jgi:hypothetical protein
VPAAENVIDYAPPLVRRRAGGKKRRVRPQVGALGRRSARRPGAALGAKARALLEGRTVVGFEDSARRRPAGAAPPRAGELPGRADGIDADEIVRQLP